MLYLSLNIGNPKSVILTVLINVYFIIIQMKPTLAVMGTSEWASASALYPALSTKESGLMTTP